MDGLSLTVAMEAVTTPPNCGPTAADGHSTRRAWPGLKALDIAKNKLCLKVTKCVIQFPKSSSFELGFRRGRLRPRRSVHDRFGVYREASYCYADRHPMWSHHGSNCRRGVCRRGMAVRSGWNLVNGRGL